MFLDTDFYELYLFRSILFFEVLCCVLLILMKNTLNY